MSSNHNDFTCHGYYRRISHRTHHQNHGHAENDESWHPVSLCGHGLSLSLSLSHFFPYKVIKI